MNDSTPLPRDAFAVTRQLLYLNHASVGVLPDASCRRVKSFIDAQARRGAAATYGEAELRAMREGIASFIGATADEIALISNTSQGANIVAGGIDWKPGDRIVLPHDEFPANAVAFLALRERGVEVDLVRQRLTPDVLRALMTPRTRAVAVSWVSFVDGYRHDLAALGSVAHDYSALFCVDAMQGLGVLDLDLAQLPIDVLYCGGQKWLLALQGSGFAFVRKAVLEQLRVAAPGWRSKADRWNFLNYEQPYAPDASRFEGGTANYSALLSLDESLRLLADVGTRHIEKHVLALTDHLVEGLAGVGATLLSTRGGGTSSAIVTFGMKNDIAELGRALAAKGVAATWRANAIRVSPHGYTSHGDIDRFLDLVKECSQQLSC